MVKKEPVIFSEGFKRAFRMTHQAVGADVEQAMQASA